MSYQNIAAANEPSHADMAESLAAYPEDEGRNVTAIQSIVRQGGGNGGDDGEMEQRIANLEKEVKALKESLTGFLGLNGKIGMLLFGGIACTIGVLAWADNKFDYMNERRDKVEEKIDKVLDGVAGINVELANIRGEINLTNTVLGNTNSRTETLEENSSK